MPTNQRKSHFHATSLPLSAEGSNNPVPSRQFSPRVIITPVAGKLSRRPSSCVIYAHPKKREGEKADNDGGNAGRKPRRWLRKRTAKTEERLGGLLRERIKRSSLGGDNWYETGCWCYISLAEGRVE